MRPLFLALACAGALGVAAPGCGRTSAARDPAASLALTDDCGRPVRLARPARRIVSLTPSGTEVLFALGLGHAVVGVTSYCTYPPEARSKPVVGDFSRPSLERIVSLSPDLVVATSLEQRRTVEEIEALGIPVYCLDPRGVEGLLRSMRRLGDLTGAAREAAALERRLRSDLAQPEAGGAPRGGAPRVFCEISPSPLMTVGDSSYVADLLRRAGGINVGWGLERDYPIVSPEFVVARDPEVIVLLHDEARAADVRGRVGWVGVTAVREGRVVDGLDLDLILRPGPRCVEGIGELRRALHEGGAGG